MIVLSTLFFHSPLSRPAMDGVTWNVSAKDPKYVDEYQYVAAYIRILTPFTACGTSCGDLVLLL